MLGKYRKDLKVDNMRNIIHILLMHMILLSCQPINNNSINKSVDVTKLTKLEQLFLLPIDSVMCSYDLSNDSIMDFPNLSAYTIKALDLSGNKLDTIIPHYLPKGLERLNLSNNRYKGYINIRRYTIPFLKEVDLSNNSLDSIRITEPLSRIVLAHNNLVSIRLNQKNVQYLDVSHNVHLNRFVRFEPTLIDTVISVGVADAKKLLGPISKNAGYHY